MARKTKIINITKSGRDHGKVFVLTELSASDAEEWAGRALFSLMNAGVEIPEDIAQAGLAGVAAIGIKALGALRFDDAKPIFDKMMECVKIQVRSDVVRDLIEDDIEEVSTRLLLRREIISLHMDFLNAAAPSTLASAQDTAASRA